MDSHRVTTHVLLYGGVAQWYSQGASYVAGSSPASALSFSGRIYRRDVAQWAE